MLISQVQLGPTGLSRVVEAQQIRVFVGALRSSESRIAVIRPSENAESPSR